MNESKMSFQKTEFLQWALPKLGYRWGGFRKPRKQVLRRIRERIHELELSGGFQEYRDYLKEHPEEWKILDRLCDITVSKFFRDRKVWEYIRENLLPGLIIREPVSIWSAGCCNGEEAYSLAIISEQLLSKKERKNINILATDRNSHVLNRALKGRYPAGALKELSDEELNKFFREVEDDSGEDYQVKSKLKEEIEFEKRDISNSLPGCTFDLVLCRNLVFTYFTKERQVRFLERLKPHLNENGFLVTGSNENLPETDWLKTESKTHRVYRVKKSL